MYWRNLSAHPELLSAVGEFATLIGSDKDFLSTRVSYKLNLRGPSVAVQTACSTSLVAVHMACQSLLGYECDMALAGGVSIGLPQKTVYRYQEEGILSPDGHCRAFDANARGTVGGSGVGVVVLKRLVARVPRPAGRASWCCWLDSEGCPPKLFSIGGPAPPN